MQVLADGLAEMWAARRDTPAPRPAASGRDGRALLASVASRADLLALRATAAAGRLNATGTFAQTAAAIRDLAARRIRPADAPAPRGAGPRSPQGEASGSAA